MENVIFIYEMIPESTKVFNLKLTYEDVEKLLKINNTYVNSGKLTDEQLEIHLEVSDRVCDNIEYCNNKEIACSWTDMELKCPVLFSKIDYVIRSGFYL